ncbi:hypothetical protein N0V93_008401 [Gnomoniopsis smithogilvyi]|uniref:Uncharacterized protein n=1 Tax=Gnomoniopsis smithogilvyi TaxID=1191159 RepID=A0A9W9CUU8_9PEZI|nr:hypothetical protein N0V93_008401 [Gnomoniopsis smithogilvyi]
MRPFTATIAALSLVVVAAVPAATGDAACATIPPPSTSSCTTTVLTVLATGAAATAPLQTPAATAASASRNNGTASTGASSNSTASTGTNVQKFTGSLGGPPPPVISSTGERPFSVNGDTFVGVSAALGRSCDIQHNACADAANSGKISADVGQCDQQNTACHAANNLKKRLSLEARRATSLDTRAAALDLGSCSDASIVFGDGIDGRNTAAFVPANQQDFNHGSALNIGVVAGFICQRLDSPCNAPSDTQASCAQASAAAVAVTQDQAAADAWNAIMGNGAGGSNAGVAGATVASAPAAAITPAPALAAMPSPAVQLMTFSSCS